MGETTYRGGDGPLAVSMCTDPHAGHRAFLAAVAQQRLQGRRALRLQHAVAGQRRRLLPEEHPRRKAPQRRGRIPDAGVVAPEPRSAIALPGDEAALRRQEGRRHRIPPRRQARDRRARHARSCCAAASIDSPKLLMLSGIGPADHLKAHGIPVIADVPGVGQQLPGSPEAVDPLERQDRAAGLDGDRRHVRALRSIRRGGDPPDLQFYVGRGLETPDRFITITVSLVMPKSRGEIRLRSADPLARADHPRQLSAGTGRRARAGARRQAGALVRRGGRVCGSEGATRSCRGRR